MNPVVRLPAPILSLSCLSDSKMIIDGECHVLLRLNVYNCAQIYPIPLHGLYVPTTEPLAPTATPALRRDVFWGNLRSLLCTEIMLQRLIQ